MDFLVNLDVDDLEKAVRFYVSALGLKPGRRFGTFGVEMLGSSAPIYLLLKSPGTLASDTASQRRSYRRHWTPVHLILSLMKSNRRWRELYRLERDWRS